MPVSEKEKQWNDLAQIARLLIRTPISPKMQQMFDEMRADHDANCTFCKEIFHRA
jgi:hypothetical protein